MVLHLFNLRFQKCAFKKLPEAVNYLLAMLSVIIAFWMSPDGVSVEIKMTFSHTIDFMDSFSGLSLTDLVPGHDTLYTGFLVCINENRNHMFPTGQDRGSASAHNDTAAFLGNFQNGFPLNIKSDLAF